MKTLFSLLVLSLFTVAELQAQNIIMEQNVNEDTVESSVGPNKKWHFGSAYGLHSIIGQSTGDTATSLIGGRSLGFTITTYQKRRLNNTFSLLTQITYRRDAFFFTPLNEETQYNKHINNDVLGELSLRINYGKRGNYVGYYAELGASGDYTFMTRRKAKRNEVDPALAYESIKTVQGGMKYINNFNYSAHFRLGFNKLVLTADYRLSDLTNNDQVMFDLPPLYVGLRFDFGA
jgi:hypothetical protein